MYFDHFVKFFESFVEGFFCIILLWQSMSSFSSIDMAMAIFHFSSNFSSSRLKTKMTRVRWWGSWLSCFCPVQSGSLPAHLGSTRQPRVSEDHHYHWVDPRQVHQPTLDWSFKSVGESDLVNPCLKKYHPRGEVAGTPHDPILAFSRSRFWIFEVTKYPRL